MLRGICRALSSPRYCRPSFFRPGTPTTIPNTMTDRVKPPRHTPRALSGFINSSRRWRAHFATGDLHRRSISKLNSLSVTEAERRANVASSAEVAHDYYVMVTRTFEAGWGQHFHYAPFAPGDTIQHALKLYVYRLALLTGLRPGMRVLDVGCGIGGPAREVAKLVGCEVIGVSINQYHVDRAIELTTDAGLGKYCTFVVADFHDLPFPEAYFDAAYAIQATAHAKDVKMVYEEVRRVVRQGGLFGSTEWAMTDLLKEDDEEHVRLRNLIEVGNGVAEMRTVSEIRKGVRAAGWLIERDEDNARRYEELSEKPPVVYEDRQQGQPKKVKSYSTIRVPRRSFDAKTNPEAWFFAAAPKEPYHALPVEPKPAVYRPWYYPLSGDKHALSLSVNQEDRAIINHMSPWKRKMTEWAFRVMILLRVAPPEHMDVIKAMWLCVDSVHEGAKLGLFTPSWLFISQNPRSPDEHLASSDCGDTGAEHSKESD